MGAKKLSKSIRAWNKAFPIIFDPKCIRGYEEASNNREESVKVELKKFKKSIDAHWRFRNQKTKIKNK